MQLMLRLSWRIGREMHDDLASNLKEVSTNRHSVSELCRELGFNRQQFARYLTGDSRPSAHNLKRIADGLEIPVADLVKPHSEFLSMYGRRSTERQTLPLIDRAFPGDIKKLRPLLGYYHGHFELPDSAGLIVRSLVRLIEHEGRVTSTSIERGNHRDDTGGYLSKYQGLVSYLGNCIFVVEFEYLTGDSIVETVLFPPYRKKLDLMSGLTFGVTSRVHRQPFASGVIWKFLGKTIDKKSALGRCGRVALSDRTLDPNVRKFFANGEARLVTSAKP